MTWLAVEFRKKKIETRVRMSDAATVIKIFFTTSINVGTISAHSTLSNDNYLETTNSVFVNIRKRVIFKKSMAFDNVYRTTDCRNVTTYVHQRPCIPTD